MARSLAHPPECSFLRTQLWVTFPAAAGKLSPAAQKTGNLDQQRGCKLYEESGISLRPGGVCAQPGPRLAGRALPAGPAILARTRTVTALPGRGGRDGEYGSKRACR